MQRENRLSAGKLYAAAFAIGPFFVAKAILLFGIRPNEWPLTPHLGIIVAFIRRTAAAETISAIFYAYAAASILLAFPMSRHIRRHVIPLNTKTAVLLGATLAYGAVLAYTLTTGPSGDSFSGAPTKANLGLQAAAMNQFTYAALCAALTAQIVGSLTIPLVAIYMAMANRT